MNPRRRRRNRQRRLDRAAVLQAAAQAGVSRERAVRSFSFGTVRVLPIELRNQNRFVHGRFAA